MIPTPYEEALWTQQLCQETAALFLASPAFRTCATPRLRGLLYRLGLSFPTSDLKDAPNDTAL